MSKLQFTSALQLGLLGLVLATGSSRSVVKGASFPFVQFDEMVRLADCIIRGTVVDIQTEGRSISDHPPEALGPVSGTTRPPATEPIAGREEGKKVNSPQAGKTSVDGPITAGTKASRPLTFDTITILVDEVVKGSPPKTISLKRIPGGTHGAAREVVIPGLPIFEKGQSYLLFLRKGYEMVGDPVVGVNQGFFRILVDEKTGEEMLLNADSDYVVAVESNRIVTRRNNQRVGSPSPSAIPPPASADPNHPFVASPVEEDSASGASGVKQPLAPRDFATIIKSISP